ncbi:MAG: DUF3237 domain-containing protein [Parvularculaceae bacterium]
MRLTQEFAFRASLKPPLPIGAGPIGTRMYYELTGGDVVGDRLNGKVLGGGEWALLGPDGFIRIDVRAQIETHDGAFLYVQYAGLLEMNAVVQKAIESGAGTGFGDQRFHINPRFETGDARYAWLNTTFFIGEGRVLPGLGVEYRVWRPT